MLAKITRGNQITIPKEIVQKAHLKKWAPYLEVSYEQGVICLKPVTVEEQVSPEQYDKFAQWALRKDKEDLEFSSLEEAIQHLKKRSKKK